MKRKYIDNISTEPYRTDTVRCKHLRTRLKHWWQRRIYGFDERETWDLDKTFYTWLYEHLMMYRDVTYVDLSQSRPHEWKGGTYTTEDLLNILIEYLTVAMTKDYEFCTEKEREQIDDIPVIWGIIIKEMWW